MLDLLVLFTVFVGLVVLLALVHRWQVSGTNAKSPQLNKKLLDEWLQAHKLKLPTVQCIFSLLNRKLQEIESEDWEKFELTDLITNTELPVFQLLKAEVSEDGRDITLCCSVEWPMCLPGLSVTVLEKGSEEPIVCHFMLDWLNAQVRIVFGEKNGVLMLSYENLQPVSMAVACTVASGHSKDYDRAASYVADTIQQTLMDLRLEQVPLVSLYGHTPSLPLVLVSPADEALSHDQSEATPTTPQTPAVEEDVGNADTATVGPDVLTQQSTEPPATTPIPLDIVTPVTEEMDPISVADSKATHPSPAAAVTSEDSEAIQSNGHAEGYPPLNANHQIADTAVAPASSTPPTSPNWRRTSSYENLQEIHLGPAVSIKEVDLPRDIALKGSSSSDRLISPTHTPSGKGLTLSMSGSEAESIYGADDRIPSSLVFEVSDSIKVRHIVALSTAHASKLRRHFSNSKKLHIYNDHCFIATHLKSRTDCGVCKDKISKLFGKQGYICRDCDLVVHKQCHYKVEVSCPTSTVSSMNLIYPETTSVSGL